MRQTVCIYVPPPPRVPSTQVTPTPALPPASPATPQTESKLTGTVTTLEVPSASEEACSAESFVGGNSILCVYSVKLNVSSVEGQALNQPLSTLTFSNPGEPGKTWTLSSPGEMSFTLEIYWEHLTTFNVEATEVIDPRYGVIASAPGKGRWSVFASYAGTSGFAPSQSSLQSFASSFF